MTPVPDESVQPINLTQAFATINDYWSPRIAAELNGQKVILAKGKGSFDWHHHEDEDELFLIHAGTLHIDFDKDNDGNARRTVTLDRGDMLLIPKGVEHRPRVSAGEEAHLVLFEPMTTLNTGSVRSENTVDAPARLA